MHWQHKFWKPSLKMNNTISNQGIALSNEVLTQGNWFTHLLRFFHEHHPMPGPVICCLWYTSFEHQNHKVRMHSWNCTLANMTVEFMYNIIHVCILGFFHTCFIFSPNLIKIRCFDPLPIDHYWRSGLWEADQRIFSSDLWGANQSI